MVARIAPPSGRTAVTVAFATGAPAGVVSLPTIAPHSAAWAVGSAAAMTIRAIAGIHFVDHLIGCSPHVKAIGEFTRRRPRYLITETGVGYRLRSDDDPPP